MKVGDEVVISGQQSGVIKYLGTTHFQVRDSPPITQTLTRSPSAWGLGRCGAPPPCRPSWWRGGQCGVLHLQAQVQRGVKTRQNIYLIFETRSVRPSVDTGDLSTCPGSSLHIRERQEVTSRQIFLLSGNILLSTLTDGKFSCLASSCCQY